MFVPETAIAGLNEQYMGKVGSTDVLAFPLDAVEVVRSPGPGAMSRGPERVPLDINDLPVMLGDVVVCPAVAMRQAPSHAGNLDDEFALLIVHGILHVLGLDHDTDEKAQTMQAAERILWSSIIGAVRCRIHFARSTNHDFQRRTNEQRRLDLSRNLCLADWSDFSFTRRDVAFAYH